MDALNPERPGSEGAAHALLSPFSFGTLSHARKDRFEVYRAFNAPVIDLSLVESPGDDFPAEQVVWNLGSFVFTRATLPGPDHVRGWRHLTRDPLDHWCLVLPLEGDGSRGNLGFRSLARPFEGRAGDSTVLSLFVPRDLFGSSAGLFDHVPTTIPDTGLGQVLADYMLLLDRRLPGIRHADLPGLAEATRALLVACLTPGSDHLALAQDPIVLTLRERARQIVRRNIRARDLGPETLCRDLGVSRSRLYRLFEPTGGVMRFIQRQRLLAAHAALSDTRDSQHIVQVAESFGFTDASGFSRAFRQEFGYTPREAREAAWAGAPRPPVSQARLPARMQDLGDLLRHLGN